MNAEYRPPCASHLDLPVSRSAPAHARHHLRIALTAWCVPQETVDTAELLVSELVTNSVTHGCPRDGKGTADAPIVLLLRKANRQLDISVTDHSSRPPAGPGSCAGPEAESGRGLAIVAALSKEWGHRVLPGGGKIVWCEMELR